MPVPGQHLAILKKGFWNKIRISTHYLSQSSRDSLLLGSSAFFITFLLYLGTLAPDLTWANFSGDGGELITAAVTLGIPHPPGYPVYTLLGKAFSTLPIGTIAYRFNLFSALTASVAAGFIVAATLKYLEDRKYSRTAAISAGMAFALTPLVWSQAVVTEVYSLNLAFLAACLWALFSRQSSILSGMLLGLAVCTHLTSLLMLPMVFLLTGSEKRIGLFLGISLGLIPLLMLPWLAYQGSPVIWGNPTTLSGWFWLISGQIFKANFSFPELRVWAPLLFSWGKTLAAQFTIGWLFVVLGVGYAYQLQRKIKSKTFLLLVTAASFICFSLIYNTPDSTVILLPALLLCVPILALGLTFIKHWSLLLPLFLLLLNFNQQNLRTDHQIRPLVKSIYSEIPPNAAVVTPGDQSIFTFWYFTHVEHQRQDLLLVDANLIAFDWYRDNLRRVYPELEGLNTDDLDHFLHANLNNRPVCFISLLNPETRTCY